MQGRQEEGVAVVGDMVTYARSLKHPPSLATALASAMGFSRLGSGLVAHFRNCR